MLTGVGTGTGIACTTAAVEIRLVTMMEDFMVEAGTGKKIRRVTKLQCSCLSCFSSPGDLYIYLIFIDPFAFYLKTTSECNATVRKDKKKKKKNQCINLHLIICSHTYHAVDEQDGFFHTSKIK
jgi:hypothetical protein